MNAVLHIKSKEPVDKATTDLLLIAGNRYINYALLNNLAKEIIEFGYYQLQNESEWQNVLRENEVFSGGYSKSIIAFNMAESMLVPSEMYKSENDLLHFEVMFGKSSDVIIVSDNLVSLHTHNLTAVPISVHAALSGKFNSTDFKNINSVLLENYTGEKEETILLDFRTDEFSVIVFKDDILQLVQIYSYSTPEDVLYYLLKICRQLNLAQQEVKVLLSGLIEKDSVVYRELYKYFIHLEFEVLPAAIKISEELEEYPAHYYSTISKLASCV